MKCSVIIQFGFAIAKNGVCFLGEFPNIVKRGKLRRLDRVCPMSDLQIFKYNVQYLASPHIPHLLIFSLLSPHRHRLSSPSNGLGIPYSSSSRAYHASLLAYHRQTCTATYRRCAYCILFWIVSPWVVSSYAFGSFVGRFSWTPPR